MCCICVKIRITAGPSVTRITDGKIRKNTGKISFTPTFRALLLRDLPEADAQIPRVRFQRRTQAGSEAIRIDQQVREFAQFHIVAAIREISAALRRASCWRVIPVAAA